MQARYTEAREALGLRALSIQPSDLERATSDRRPFDVVGWELLGRTGGICEMLVEATGFLHDGSKRGLSLDEAVNGGLLVRLTKLLRALFDSTQSDESEAHQILARCAGETAVNLRWLLVHGEAEHYRRFRADSFAVFMRVLEKTDPDHEDPVVGDMSGRLARFVEAELRDADIAREDIPKRPGFWAGSLRERFRDLGREGFYDAFFATHSDYVHGSWHELRTFHLNGVADGYELDMTYGGLTPSAMYETTRLILEAVGDYAEQMPVAGFDLEAMRVVLEGTIEAAGFSAAHFARFFAEGGIDELMADRERLPAERLEAQIDAAHDAVRRRVQYQTESSGGKMISLERDEAPWWAKELIRQFNAARPSLRVCPHLTLQPRQPSIWLALLPDLLACQGRECERRLIPTLEARLGHGLKDEPARCSACGRQALVQGVSVGAGTTMIRGMICEECTSGAKPADEAEAR